MKRESITILEAKVLHVHIDATQMPVRGILLRVKHHSTLHFPRGGVIWQDINFWLEEGFINEQDARLSDEQLTEELNSKYRNQEFHFRTDLDRLNEKIRGHYQKVGEDWTKQGLEIAKQYFLPFHKFAQHICGHSGEKAYELLVDSIKDDVKSLGQHNALQGQGPMVYRLVDGFGAYLRNIGELLQGICRALNDTYERKAAPILAPIRAGRGYHSLSAREQQSVDGELQKISESLLAQLQHANEVKLFNEGIKKFLEFLDLYLRRFDAELDYWEIGIFQTWDGQKGYAGEPSTDSPEWTKYLKKPVITGIERLKLTNPHVNSQGILRLYGRPR